MKPASYKMCTADGWSGLKRPERETVPLHPTIAKVTYEWSFISTPVTLFHGVVRAHRGSFLVGDEQEAHVKAKAVSLHAMKALGVEEV
jgi:hypothetical protein